MDFPGVYRGFPAKTNFLPPFPRNKKSILFFFSVKKKMKKETFIKKKYFEPCPVLKSFEKKERKKKLFWGLFDLQVFHFSISL